MVIRKAPYKPLQRAGLLCALGLAVSAASATGQQLSPQQLQQLMEAQPNGANANADTESAGDADWAARAANSPRLDRTVDRALYTLGPGDQLILAVFGYRNEVFPLTVTPEGTVVIPTVGIVSVDGLNLNEANRAARRKVLRFYPDSEVELSLSAVRSFNIFVVGAVPEPGIRGATAVTRVSEVVPATSDSVVLRSTTIRRGAEILPIDLTRFLQTGDLRFNPFVRAGDVIQVPVVDHTVTIAGEVPYPGTYEYLPGETLADILRIVNGGEPFLTRAADTLLVMRFTDDPRGEILEIPREEAVGARGDSFALHPFDAVFVPTVSRSMRRTMAKIEGEVHRPGSYPIRTALTTIGDLVEMAGGFTPQASTGEVLLRREASLLMETTANPLTVIPPDMLTPQEQRILQVTAQSDENTSLIDLARNPAALELPLEDGDVILVPHLREEVTVLGAVARPGLVMYQPGETIDDFVLKAGGYVRRADRGDVVVLRTRSGAQLHRREIENVEPGDRIVVPFREHSTFLERVQTAQGVISTFSGIILTFVGLERLWDTIAN